MHRYVLAQLRRRFGRTIALFLAVLAATTGFTVLTGSTTTSRLKVVGTVRSNYRGAYDILVRPKGARTAIERERGLVANNTLSGTFGGITVDQWQRIRQVNGVEVAAPIAMYGNVTSVFTLAVLDITELVDRGKTRQMLRLTPTWYADRGLTTGTEQHPGLVYVTKRPVTTPVGGYGGNRNIHSPGFTGRYDDGGVRPDDVCHTGFAPPYEIQEDGTALPICLQSPDPDQRAYDLVVRLLPDGSFKYVTDLRPREGDWAASGRQSPTRLLATMQVTLALLVAGIDPGQEAALVGLDDAVTDGYYLYPFDATKTREMFPTPPEMRQPVMLASQLEIDEHAVVDAARVEVGGNPLTGRPLAGLRTSPDLPIVARVQREVRTQDAYAKALAAVRNPDDRSDPDQPPPNQPVSWQYDQLSFDPFSVIRSGQPRFVEQPDGSLRPQSQRTAYEAYAAAGECQTPHAPWLAHDVAFRPVTATCVESTTQHVWAPKIVGIYDSTRLRSFNELTQVPLETYHAPEAAGADGASQRLLGDQPLLPNDNPGNYLAPSPTILTTFDVLWQLGAPDDLISAVRVRVDGLTGFDPTSRERVRLVAEDIARATGLDVDIMLGASPAAQAIDLPAGSYGRPRLHLAENWTKMGVAAAILTAVDRKSVALFVLILIVCALFLGNATGAAVRARRLELAVLACLGWPGRRLAALTLIEVGIVGLVAGGASVALSVPISRAVGAAVSWREAALAIPAALVLALAAAIAPALRASRTRPIAAVQAVATPPRRPRRHQGLPAIAWSNLGRVRGRTALAVVALAVAVATLTLLAAVLIAFHGSMIGTMLGDAVSIRIRGVDTAAVVAAVLLATIAVADVLYLGIRERASELAALKATGWSTAAVARLIGYEALAIGALAALLGVAAGVGGAVALTGALPATLVAVAAGTALAGPVLAGLAAVVPALLLRRLPVTTLLAKE